MELTSGAFKNGEDMPRRYTGAGDDISPGLKWSGVPDGTESFVLIMDDPDAPGGTWVHWVMYNIPKDVKGLVEDVPKERVLTEGAGQGKNSFGRIGYGGPHPPPGPAHRYVFTLYALDTALNLAPGADKSAVSKAMQGRVLDKAQLTGMFGR
ncbi:MAG: YbhB/YbcL family Raf kinase inhibitor-like protein [Candidatus Omnitrophota bacterium]